MPWWAWLPLIVLSVLLVLLGIVALVGRIDNGRYLRPVIMSLSRVGFMRRWFQRMSLKGLERSNPELAAAMKKMNTFGEPKSAEQAQRMLNLLTPAERRAYMGAIGEEGQMPEPTNRQQRRRIEHGGQGMPTKAAAASTRPGAAGRKTGKKKR
jgi:hypothetical protein